MPIALHNVVDADESGECAYRHITPEEFAELDPNTVTLLDLREPADFAAHPVEGAINAPLDPLAHVLKTVPKDRTVVVYCAQGWWSEWPKFSPIAVTMWPASMEAFKAILIISNPTTINSSTADWPQRISDLSAQGILVIIPDFERSLH